MAKSPKRKVRVDCGRYLIRTLSTDDASEHWGSWMDEKSRRLVNAPSNAMTKKDIETYIRQFDQRSHLLLGIFEKPDAALVGFFRIDIDHQLNRCLLYLMLKRSHRHLPRIHDIHIPFYDFVFETLGMKTGLATVLASNRAMKGFMLRTGWSLDRQAARHVKSNRADEMLDLCYLSITREAWRNWKAQNAESWRATQARLSTARPGDGHRSDS